MSDILSKYFENISNHKKNNSNMRKQSSTLSQDLSDYGLLLSDNNILSFTPKKIFSSLRKINSKKNEIYSNINFPYFSEKTNKYNTLNLSEKGDNIKIVVNKEKFLSDNENKNLLENNNKLKIKNNIINNNSLYENYKSNLNFLKKNRFFENKSKFISNIFDIENSLYNQEKELKTKKENDKKKINLILKDLQSKIKFKRNFKKKKSFQFSFSINNSLKQPEINPMKYIQMNLSENPHNSSKFKSYNIQVKLIGNEKNRNLLLDGVNFYNNNYVKYKNIKPTMIYNTKYEKKQKIIHQKINKMLHGIKRPKLIFKTQYNNYKKNKKLLKNINAFSFENKYKETKNKRIDNLNYRLNLISKNDIVSINNYIEKNRKYLSFDKKINLLLLRAQKTSNYIKKRAEEYSKINKIIFESIV